MKNLGWWLLDYAYAGWRQLLSLFRCGVPASYAEGDPALPAIVLLPGVFETWLFLEPAATRLNSAGFRVFSVPALGINSRPVPESASLVNATLAQLAQFHGVTDCILLAHSKGGLIGKHAMLDAGSTMGEPAVGSRKGHLAAPGIAGLVAVATPFSGSPYARYLFPRTLRDFSPANEVLLSLLARKAMNHRVVSIYPAFDPHIPGGSALAGALNVELPISGHFRTLADETLLAAVEHAVKGLGAAT